MIIGKGLSVRYEKLKEPGENFSVVEYFFSVRAVEGATIFADETIYVLRFPRRRGPAETIGLAWLPIALAKLVSTIQIADSPTSGEVIIIKVDPAETPNWHVRQCAHQSVGATGLKCGAWGISDHGKTTFALCQTCDLPDERIRCSHLAHYTVNQIKPTLRGISDAMCELGHSQVRGMASGCHAGGHPCWEKTIRLPSPLESIEQGLEDRVCDEIDHWNLAIKHLHGKRIIQTTQLRTVKELITPCKNERDFKSKVQVLADLIARIGAKSFLSAPLPEEKQGSLYELASFYSEHKYDPGDSIKILRAITQLRQDFPAHSGNERVITACRTLGIPYPPDDWSNTWKLVLRAFTGAVQTLRAALPAE